MQPLHAFATRVRRAGRLHALIGGARAEALTEYAIILAVIVLGVVAVLALMRGGTSGDLAVLVRP